MTNEGGITIGFERRLGIEAAVDGSRLECLLCAHYGCSEQLGCILEADILVRALADRDGWVSAGRFASRSTA